jgi:hypothetical protein
MSRSGEFRVSVVSVHHHLPEVSLRVAFAQLAAVFAEDRASYVPARGDILTPVSASRWWSDVPRRGRGMGSLGFGAGLVGRDPTAHRD